MRFLSCTSISSTNNLYFLNLNFFIIFLFFIFFLSCCALILYKKNLILVLVSLEIILLSANMLVIPSSLFLDDIMGYLFSLFTLSVAGAEVSIGLALAIILYRNKAHINITKITFLKS